MDYDELRIFLLEKMQMYRNYQPIILKTLLESPNFTAPREQIINKLKAANDFEERDWSQILWDVVEEVLGKQGREIAKRNSQTGDCSLNVGEITDEQKNNLINLCDEKIIEIDTKNMIKVDGQQYFLLQVSKPGSTNILQNGKYNHPNWDHSIRNKSHGDIKVDDLILVYFAGKSIDHKQSLKMIYQVKSITEDKVGLTLELWKELKGISYKTLMNLIKNQQLGNVFVNIGKEAFNIAQLTKDDFEKILDIDGGKQISQTKFQNEIDKERKSQLENYKTILNQSKGQIIFYGPPGTGKTFIAKQLANLITNAPLNEKWTTSPHRKIVQFHPSYSYEDFVQGIKPIKKGHELDYQVKPGIFQNFCQEILDLPTMTWKNAAVYVLHKEQENGDGGLHYKAITKKSIDLGINPLGSTTGETPFYSQLREMTEEIRTQGEKSIFKQSEDGNGNKIRGTYEMNKESSEYSKVITNLPDAKPNSSPKVLIIDEINRGNLSKIFGELIYGLEYRGEEIDLQYKEFDDTSEFGTLTIPPKEQLMVIGSMNTADRSIILFDAALRRRFSFIPLFPDYNLLAQTLDIAIAYDRDKFNEKLTGTIGEQENKILSILVLEILNSQLADDVSIGREKQIGHTFLLELQDHPQNFEKVWKRDILPLLEEYYFDRPKQIEDMFGAAIYTVKDGIKEFDKKTLHKQLTKYKTDNDENN